MVIGIIGAFDPEIDKYIDMYNMQKEDNNRFDIYVGYFNDKKIVMIKSGVGKVNAAIATQYLIDNYKIEYLINSGCAGSISEKVNIMDVVIADVVTYHDFKPIRIMESYVPERGLIKPDPILVNITKDVINNIKNINYHVGVICTGDSFIEAEEMRNQINSLVGLVLAVDMESAAIGHACKINKIPFLIIRTISDNADGVENFEEEASYQSSYIVKEIVEYLK